MSEKTAYQWLKEVIVESGDRIDRLENLVSVGMPDVNACLAGHELWIEIKAPKEPVRSTTKLFGSNHKVSQDQANWMLRQIKAGGQCYFFVVTDKQRFLMHGRLADDINSFTVAQMEFYSTWRAPIITTSEEKIALRTRLIRKP